MSKKQVVLLIMLIIFSSNTIEIYGYENRLKLEIVNEIGDWDEITPMYVKTTNATDHKLAQTNATNINSTNYLYALQYFKYKIDFIEYELPTVSKTNIIYIHYLMMNFTSDNTVLRVSYRWDLEYDTGVVIYVGYLKIFVNSTIVFNESYTTYEKTHQFEIQIWRTKSDQLGVYFKVGEESTEDEMEILDPLLHWNLGNLTYWFSDEAPYTGYFTARFEDLSIQSGVDDGIADPIENPDWGFFEPLRQVLMFIVNIFVGLMRVILPDSIENFFDGIFDSISDFSGPIIEIIVWIGENFLEVIIAVNMFLLINGIEKAMKGELSEVITPFLTFYGFLFGVSFKVIGFVVSIIKIIVEAIPL